MIVAAPDLATPRVETDILVIGGGPVGLALAARLDRQVVVLEGGRLTHDPALDKHFAVILTGTYFDVARMRRRLVGGMGRAWSGRCAELNPVDFEARPGIVHSGWPIDAAELAPWYAAVRKDLGLGLQAPSPRAASLIERPDAIEAQVWQYALRTPNSAVDLSDIYLPALRQARNRTLITDAHVTRLVSDGRRVTHVEARTLGGRQIEIAANEVILACGCIEASRLLLASAEAGPALTGAVTKWLGRGFHQHLLIDGGAIAADRNGAIALQQSFNHIRRRGQGSTETGLRPTDAAQRSAALLNISATFRYAARAPYRPGELLDLARRWFAGREPLYTRPGIRLEYSVEQRIDPERAIGLSGERDALGMRRATVRWTIDDQELDTMRRFSAIMAAWLADRRLGRHAPIATLDQARAQPMRESLHHMGGARMSDDAADGVVDRNLRVHGTANLWVAGGAVFPTGGHANPTFTMLALAARLADHLGRHNRRAGPPVSAPSTAQATA